MKKFLPFFIVLLCGCMGAPTAGDVGQKYLGAKYERNPIGIEKTSDTLPVVRTDAFDCVTFVETVLSRADPTKLAQIRYKDALVDLLHRNHFIETDWLGNNADIVQNVSSKFGKTTTKHVVIDKKNWFRHRYGMETDFAPRAVDIEYIPYENAHNITTDQPMIVLFIADNSKKRATIGSDMAVAHMGFLLPGGILRHASSEQGAVVDTDFSQYITARAKNKNNLGIALVDIKWQKIK